MYSVRLWDTDWSTKPETLGEYDTWREAKERASLYADTHWLTFTAEDPEIGDEDWTIWGPRHLSIVVGPCNEDHPHAPWEPGGEFTRGWEERYKT